MAPPPPIRPDDERTDLILDIVLYIGLVALALILLSWKI
jgi:hypothetical protein